MTCIRYAAPALHFSDYVSAYYLVETEAACLEQIEPAGLAQMRFLLCGTASIQPQSGEEIPLAPAALIGPRNGANLFRINGPARIFGFGLRPQGWCAATRMPAANIADQACDAQLHGGGPIGQVYARLCAATTFHDMIRITEKYLAMIARNADILPQSIIHAIENWLRNSPNPRIADLLAQSGLTDAQAQRQCKALFGAPPKLLARKHRALHMARQIAAGQAAEHSDWSLEIDRIFYDQSHCIRELRHFIGLTPSAIRSQSGQLPLGVPLSGSKGGWADLWPAS